MNDSSYLVQYILVKLNKKMKQFFSVITTSLFPVITTLQ